MCNNILKYFFFKTVRKSSCCQGNGDSKGLFKMFKKKKNKKENNMDFSKLKFSIPFPIGQLNYFSEKRLYILKALVAELCISPYFVNFFLAIY